MLQQAVTPFLVREFMNGMEQTALDALPSMLRGQLESIRRRIIRQAIRAEKRETKARQYRIAAIAGGGQREVARRSGQLFRQRAIDAL